MKGIKIVIMLVLYAWVHFALAKTEPHTAVISAEQQEAKTPQQVLQRLKEGNQRFITGKLKNRNLLVQANTSAIKQHPVAIILSCMDSRTPPEVIFDQGIGDVFVNRIAGNIQNSDVLGGMEFGTKLVGAKLIAVIGHTNCGAMRGACQQAALGNLTGLLEKIQPAVKEASKKAGAKDCDKASFIDEIAKENVLQVMKEIQKNSPVLDQLIKEGAIGIVGGIQNLATGEVQFFDEQSIMPKA